jgi:hypothetical protein
MGDRVVLTRAHPCGSSEWQVVRLGADIGLACNGCGHRVMLERRRLEQRLRSFTERGPG